MPSTTATGTVPRLPVFLLTLIWAAPLAALLCNAVFGLHTFEHRTYELGRFAVIVAMLLLALVGLLRAFDLVGVHAGDPWYMDPLLVALVLFWGLFPPMWFFVEYLSFDRGMFALPSPPQDAAAASGNPASGAEQSAKLKADFLASTKLYADLASKVWVAVGTALGAIIALAKRP